MTYVYIYIYVYVDAKSGVFAMRFVSIHLYMRRLDGAAHFFSTVELAQQLCTFDGKEMRAQRSRALYITVPDTDRASAIASCLANVIGVFVCVHV